MLQRNPHVSSSARVNAFREGAKHSSELIRNTDKLTNHVYSNVLINNNTDKSLRAEYSTVQDIPILGDQQDYKLKVSRFKIPMTNVPLFKFKDGAYRFTWGYQPKTAPPSNVFTEIGQVYTVQFIPALSQSNDLLTVDPYDRAVFNISDFLEMINFKLAQMWTNLLANLTEPGEILETDWGPPPGLAVNNPPTFVYDCEENCIKFRQPVNPSAQDYPQIFSSIFDCGDGDQQFRLLMSEELWSFFNGFQADYYGESGIIDLSGGGIPYSFSAGLRFLRGSIDEETAFGPCPPYEFMMTVPQTVSSIYAFQQVTRIIVTTNLSLVKESVLIESETSGNPVRFEVLTDFELQPSNTINHNEPVYYYGDDSDRFYNIKDSGPLYKLDIGIFVQWKSGERTQLYIAPGESVYMKLHFERKFANNNYQITDANSYSQSGF